VRILLQDFEIGLRGFTGLEIHNGAVLPVAVYAQGRIDLDRLPGESAAGEQVIRFPHITGLELAVQVFMRLFRAGKEHYSAGLAVQAVDDPQTSELSG